MGGNARTWRSERQYQPWTEGRIPEIQRFQFTGCHADSRTSVPVTGNIILFALTHPHKGCVFLWRDLKIKREGDWWRLYLSRKGNERYRWIADDVPGNSIDSKGVGEKVGRSVMEESRQNQSGTRFFNGKISSLDGVHISFAFKEFLLDSFNGLDKQAEHV